MRRFVRFKLENRRTGRFWTRCVNGCLHVGGPKSVNFAAGTAYKREGVKRVNEGTQTKRWRCRSALKRSHSHYSQDVTFPGQTENSVSAPRRLPGRRRSGYLNRRHVSKGNASSPLHWVATYLVLFLYLYVNLGILESAYAFPKLEPESPGPRCQHLQRKTYNEVEPILRPVLQEIIPNPLSSASTFIHPPLSSIPAQRAHVVHIRPRYGNQLANFPPGVAWARDRNNRGNTHSRFHPCICPIPSQRVETMLTPAARHAPSHLLSGVPLENIYSVPAICTGHNSPAGEISLAGHQYMKSGWELVSWIWIVSSKG